MRWLLLLLPLTAWAGEVPGGQVGVPARIVSLGGGVTEILYALGVGDRVVGTDSSSRFPAAAEVTPKVGYYRALSAEGVLSLGPELVVGMDNAGPPSTLSQLEAARVPVALLPSEPDLPHLIERIEQLGALVDRGERASELIATVQHEVAAVARPTEAPRVLFIYARGGGTLNVAGTATAADAMIRLAGGVNAVTGYEGYQALNAEAAVAAAPDVLLITTDGLQALGGRDALLANPALALTPAGRAGRVVAMDDLYLLGFGPRVGQAAAELAVALGGGR